MGWALPFLTVRRKRWLIGAGFDDVCANGDPVQERVAARSDTACLVMRGLQAEFMNNACDGPNAFAGRAEHNAMAKMEDVAI